MPGKSERELVSLLERTFRSRGSRQNVVVGIGDDAAVLAPQSERLVLTVDTAIDGVHFRRDWLSPSEIGRRSFHAAASDIAAMGAAPIAALSNLVIPKSMKSDGLRALVEGQARAAKELRCPMVGGNLSRGRDLGITTTVVGRVREPLLRSGARPGDELWLVGSVGMARAGLLWLSGTRARARLRADAADRRALARCVKAWRQPRALIREGARLHGRARSAIDVSDGLSSDARHLADESVVRVVIERATLSRALPRELTTAGRVLGAEPLDLALTGGEDYALLATGPRGKRPPGAKRIGRVEKGRGVFLESEDGARRVLRGGFDHFE